MPKLTAAGIAWAMSHADDSQIAKVALLAWAGGGNDWPENFRRTAINVCNENGKA